MNHSHPSTIWQNLRHPLAVKEVVSRMKILSLHSPGTKQTSAEKVDYFSNLYLIEKMLECSVNYFNMKEFNSPLTEFLTFLISNYCDKIAENPRLKELLKILSKSINEEVAFQEKSLQTLAFLSCFQK